jgi:phosphonate transport system substrate-binding protein
LVHSLEAVFDAKVVPAEGAKLLAHHFVMEGECLVDHVDGTEHVVLSQSNFNAVADLLVVGLLSQSLAHSLAGNEKHASVVLELANGKLDMAWLGGFTFVQAKIRTNGTAIPIVQREEDAKFTSKFITAQADIQSLADLKGKSFAFGAPSSTSGSLMPRYFLQQAGLTPEKDFKNVAYSGAHDATAAFVASGKVQAGVLNASVWEKLVEQKKVDTSKVRVFATTPPYFDYNWTVRGDLDPALIAKLTQAFLQLDPANPQHKEILALQRASKFIPTAKENYDGIEKAALSAGLLK